MGIDWSMACTPASSAAALAPPVSIRPLDSMDHEPALLSLTLTWSGARCVLTVAGALDAHSSIALETELDQLVRAGFEEVILGVEGVDTMDESGAVALAELWAQLRNNGVFCRVRGLHPAFGDSPLELLLFVRNAGPDGLARAVAEVPG